MSFISRSRSTSSSFAKDTRAQRTTLWSEPSKNTFIGLNYYIDAKNLIVWNRSHGFRAYWLLCLCAKKDYEQRDL